MEKKLLLLALLATSSGVTVLASSHSKAYLARQGELKQLKHVYQNSDGTVGGVFKLVDGTFARIEAVTEKGNVLVSHQGETKVMSQKELDSFIKRAKGE